MSDEEKKAIAPVPAPELMMEPETEATLAEFELHLARAMRRVDVPEGFAARVMERAAGPEGVVAASAQVSEARPFGKLRAGSGAPAPGRVALRVVMMRPRLGTARMRAWAGGAVAAALALGMFGAEQLHRRQVRAAQTALANQQFAMAVQVTGHALAQTREQLQRAGLNLGE